MNFYERELLRLQVLLSLWPAGAGREEFESELHLKRALEEAYGRAFPAMRDYTWPNPNNYLGVNGKTED